mgnify:CR=1 FL=1
MVTTLEPEALLEHVVRSLVDRPDEVRVVSMVGEATATFEIHVADSDVGRVLGKGGQYPDALRVLFGAIFGKHGKRLQLQVVEPRRR